MIIIITILILIPACYCGYIEYGQPTRRGSRVRGLGVGLLITHHKIFSCETFQKCLNIYPALWLE
jgi:hypothetical protein